MSLIVVDTNIITYALIDIEQTALAREVYRRDGDWIVPMLWQRESRGIRKSDYTFSTAFGVRTV